MKKIVLNLLRGERERETYGEREKNKIERTRTTIFLNSEAHLKKT